MYGKYPKAKATKKAGGKKKKAMGGKVASSATSKRKAMKVGGRMKRKSC